MKPSNDNHQLPVRLSVLLLALGLVATACDDDTTPTSDAGADMADTDDMTGDMVDDSSPDMGDDTSADIPVEFGEVRVLHLSRDAGLVDIFVNAGAAPAIPDLDFLDGTDYVPLPAGTYDFQVALAGDSAEDAVLELTDVELPAGVSATAVAIGDAAPSGGSAALDSLVLVDDLSDPGTDSIRIRPIHAASIVGQVDLWDVTDPTSPLLLYPDLDFGDVGDYATVPEGAYSIGVDTNNDETPELVFNLPSLDAGAVANLYAAADADDNIFIIAQLDADVLVQVDPVGPANLRVIHLSDSAPDVDIYVDGAIAREDLSFEESTLYIPLGQGAYDIDVTVADDSIDNAVISLDDVVLDGDTKYTAVAFGPVADLQTAGFALLVDDDEGITADSLRVRAFHAANGVGQVDIWSMPTAAGSTAIPLIPDLDYGAEGPALDIPPAFYILGVDTTDDGVPDLEFNVDVSGLAADTFVNVFAVTDGTDVFLTAQLPDSTLLAIEPAGTAEIRVVHLSPDAPNVDVFVNDGTTPAFSDLPFSEATDFADLGGQGLFTFKVSGTGDTPANAVLTIEDILLLGDESYTAVAFDDLAAPIQALALQEDYSATESGKIRVRAIHTANATAFATVDVLASVDGGAYGPLYDDFVFGEIGDYIDADAGTYIIGLDVDNNGAPDATFTLGAVAAGTIVNIFAVNDDSDSPFLIVLGDSGIGARVNPDS